MAEPDAMYLPLGDGRFRSTRHTVGPWSPDAQHGGPPSALLAHAIEALPCDGPRQVARLTTEILGPVPVAELAVHAEVVRGGRSVELVEATLRCADRVVMRARAWRIRTGRIGTAATAAAGVSEQPPALPATATEIIDPRWRSGYLLAIEWRFTEGGLSRQGPATAWTRLRVPLVAGEQPSPLQRVVVVADSGNGISSQLDLSSWWFINPELTVHLHRPPVGEWVCLQARSTVQDSGIGLAESILYDGTGTVGRGAQALLIGPR